MNPISKIIVLSYLIYIDLTTMTTRKETAALCESPVQLPRFYPNLTPSQKAIFSATSEWILKIYMSNDISVFSGIQKCTYCVYQTHTHGAMTRNMFVYVCREARVQLPWICSNFTPIQSDWQTLISVKIQHTIYQKMRICPSIPMM